jgi:hypothetical protein
MSTQKCNKIKATILHFTRSLNDEKFETHPAIERLCLPTFRAPFTEFLREIRPYLKQKRIIYINLKRSVFIRKSGTAYRRGWTTEKSICESQQRQRNVSFLTASRPALGGPPTLHSKRQGSEADQPPPSRAEVKNGRAIPPLPHMSSWRCG